VTEYQYFYILISDDMKNRVERMEDLSTDALSDLWILAVERPDLREQARILLQARIAKGSFSMEQAKACGGHVVNVWFTATSSAFEHYGRYVTGSFIIPPSVAMQMALANDQNGSTPGMVQFDGMDSHLTPQLKADLRGIGFHTNDVVRITF